LGLPHIIAHPLGLSNLLEGQLKAAMVINAPHLSATTEIILMAITLTAVVITIILSKRKYGSVRSMTAEERNLTLVEKWAFNKFYLDELYATVVTNNMDRLAQFTQRWADELVFQNISSLSGRSVRELGFADEEKYKMVM
jgi:NADH:ubiquinone oxidoreductase subunit 5 (subunit L)/multisubunit Na+/H+ antiporter MnhA subunit